MVLSLPFPVCSAAPKPSERRDDYKVGKPTKMDLSCAPHLCFSVNAALSEARMEDGVGVGIGNLSAFVSLLSQRDRKSVV